MRDKVTGARRWVVKIGSALLTADGRGLDRNAMAVWVEQMVALHCAGIELVLVSSGAVAAGMSRLGWVSRPSAMHFASLCMPRIVFAPAIQRHVAMPALDVGAATVAAALQAAFAREPRLRGYLLDDQGSLRRHVALFVDGVQVRDRRGLGDPLQDDSEIYVVQALSGG